MEGRCGQCKYFNRYYEECRIKPPVVVNVQGSGETNTVWPKVSTEDWCGEFGER